MEEGRWRRAVGRKRDEGRKGSHEEQGWRNQGAIKLSRGRGKRGVVGMGEAIKKSRDGGSGWGGEGETGWRSSR